MPPSDAAFSDQVILQCPACGASEAADSATLGDAPTIVCRDCGETWPAAARRAGRVSLDLGRDLPGSRIDAVRKPIITYSGEPDPAWARKAAGDVLPRNQRRRSAIPRATAALASMLFIGAFFGGREAAVAALPDLAGFYDSIGLPVNLDRLEIRLAAIERQGGDAGRVSVRGEIANLAGAERPVPPLQVSFFDRDMAPAGAQAFDPPDATLAGEQAAPFTLELSGVPPHATTLVLRFRRADEPELRIASGPEAAP